MYNLYLDHTDYYYQEESCPDTIVFAGLLIKEEDEKNIRDLFETNISLYSSDKFDPIKWNFKDLKGHYEKEENYESILSNMPNLRENIFKNSHKLNYNVIYSSNRIRGTEKNGYSIAKKETIKYSFSNTLMRVGLKMEKEGSSCKVICDWPNGNNKKPYEEEYDSAFKLGKTSNGIQYFCGPLNEIGFDSTVYFTSTTSSRSLQFVDLLLGSFTLGFTNFMKRNNRHPSIRYTQSNFKKILNSSNYRLLPHGISVSSRDIGLKKDMQSYISILDLKKVLLI